MMSLNQYSMASDKGKRGFQRVEENPYDLRMGKKRRLLDEYQFPGFRPMSKIQGIFGDPKASCYPP